MNDKQKRFVIEYCKDENGTQAAIRAGYSEKTAQEQSSRLLSKVMVQDEIAARMNEIAVSASITVEAVLKKWWEIASADPNELMQLRRVNCRHCWGFDHAYQWTKAEYEKACQIAITRGHEAPDGMGGFGYLVNGEANPECPECGGNGQDMIHFEDTRKLKGSARTLFAGVQKTKDGIKILTRDQDAALLNIARYLGMLAERKESDGGGDQALADALSKLADRLPN